MSRKYNNRITLMKVSKNSKIKCKIKIKTIKITNKQAHKSNSK